MLIRTVHNATNPFVQLQKTVLRHPTISLKAKGLWAMCLSYPDDWEFYVEQLAADGPDGKKAIYSAIKELVQAGLAMCFQIRGQKEEGKGGKRHVFGHVEYIFFENPVTSEEKLEWENHFKNKFAHRPFGQAQNGRAQNGTLLRKRENVKNKVGKETEQAKEDVVVNSLEKINLDALDELDLDVIERKEIGNLCLKKGIADLNPFVKVLKQFEQKNGAANSQFLFLLKAIHQNWIPNDEAVEQERHKRVARYLEDKATEAGKMEYIIVLENACLVAPPMAGNEGESHKWTFKYSDPRFISKILSRATLILPNLDASAIYALEAKKDGVHVNSGV